jgi:precorrin-6B methylase 2
LTHDRDCLAAIAGELVDQGAGPTTRRRIEGISRAGIADGSLLDIGAGVGALTFELLECGVTRAVIVESCSTTRSSSCPATALHRIRTPSRRSP